MAPFRIISLIALKSRQLGPRVIMPKLQNFMHLPYAQFTSRDDRKGIWKILFLQRTCR
jgi:hypothetical protein